MKRSALLFTAAIALALPVGVATPVRAENPLPPASSLPGSFDTTRLLAMIDWLIAKVDGSPLSPEVAGPLRSSLVALRAQVAAGDLPGRGELEALAEQVRVALAELGITPPTPIVDPTRPGVPGTPGALPGPGQVREWIILAIDRATAMLESSDLPADDVASLLAELAALRADVEAGIDVRERAAGVFDQLRDLLMRSAPDMPRPPALPDDPQEAIAILERVAERVTSSPMPERLKEIVLGHLDDLVQRIEQSDGSVADAIEQYRRARFEAVRTRLDGAIDHVGTLVEQVLDTGADWAEAEAGAATSTLDTLRAEVAVATSVADLRTITIRLLAVRADLLELLEPAA